MTNETPSYVKQNAIIGALLLVPFFLVVASNVLSHDNLSNSNGWKIAFFTLLVVLPAMAFLLNAATFIKWVSDRKKGFWKSLFDFGHNWPTLLIGGLALLIFLFVPFHDSVHCVTGNPVSELRNWHDTWHCIQTG